MALSASGASQAGLEPAEGSSTPQGTSDHPPPVQQMVKSRELTGTESSQKRCKTRLCTNNKQKILLQLLFCFISQLIRNRINVKITNKREGVA